MPVHYAGAPCDLAAIRALAGGRIAVLEDAAHAAGARLGGRPIGADSELAVFSFHPTKNLTTAEGGMVVCQRDDWAERLRLGRFHGIRKDAWKNATRSGKDGYSVIAPGRKYNLTDIQAVLGIHQLAELDALNARRAALALRYRERLAGLRALRPLALPTAGGALHAWHIFVVLLDLERLGCDRAAVVDRLEQRGIGTGVHFLPVHSQQYYAARYPATRLPVTDRIGARLLSLPLFPGMADGDVDRVVDALTAIERELIP
jgi:UDP-4-amino-4-deoxy-L-arabinose-oxoglutarate aminotransferase